MAAIDVVWEIVFIIGTGGGYRSALGQTIVLPQANWRAMMTAIREVNAPKRE